jgi:hypothetical protein
MKLETIQINANNKAGYVVVNKDDDPKTHAKWGVKVPSKSLEAVEVEAEAPQADEVGITLTGADAPEVPKKRK